MKTIPALLLALSAALAAPAAAQSGFALKGHYILNGSTADVARADRQVPTADGVGLGAEVVLGSIGLGVSGFTAEEVSDLDYRTSELTVIGEANYFLRLPVLPLAPYAGVHVGLGRLSREDVDDSDLEIRDRTRSQLGYQLGVRFQATPLLGFDAQWRRMSTSAAEGQDSRFERDQFLIGVTLF